MKFISAICICLIICLSPLSLSGQAVEDTILLINPVGDSVVVKEKKGSIFSGRPGKSMLMSLVIPGTGQLYNKSYLRVPFIWGAVGGMGYWVSVNTKEYQCLKNAYIAAIDNVPYEFPDHCDKYDQFVGEASTLKILRDEANKNKQLSIIGFSLVWLANGIDAFVNAHLKSFDIDENLSINIRSKVDNDPNSPMRMGLFVSF